MSFVNEPRRISFIESRDGIKAAVEFCKQGMLVYRRAIGKKPDGSYNFARQPMYRRQYVESLLCFRRYIRERS